MNQKRIDSYRPPPPSTASFSMAREMVDRLHGFRINGLRIVEVLAHLSSPRNAERVRKVIVEKHPHAGFRNIESAVEFGAIRKQEPIVIFTDDKTIGGLNREKIAKDCPNAVVVLLSSRESVCSMPPQHSAMAHPEISKAELVAAMVGAENLDFEETVHAFIHLSEDKLNIEQGSSDAKRFVVLVVDDEPRWISGFLPQLYSIIGRRADIMVKRTYESAVGFIDERGEDIVCIISDMSFPRAGAMDNEAGRALIGFAHEGYPRIAKVISTKGPLPFDLRDKALPISKGSADSLEALRRFMLDYSGFGDFLIPVQGRIMRVKSIHEMRDAVSLASLQTIEEYGRKDFFSTWLYLHGFYHAGDRIRPNRSVGETLRGFLLREFGREIEGLGKDPFVILSQDGSEECRTFSLGEIASRIKRMHPHQIEKWEEDDFLSFWLMRHGYSELADELRPIQGYGNQIREQVLSAFKRWTPIYESRGSQGG